MKILQFLIMKKCNMFVDGSEQCKGSAACQFVVHDCRAEERVKCPRYRYTVQWNPDPANSRGTPPPISPGVFLIGFTQISVAPLMWDA